LCRAASGVPGIYLFGDGAARGSIASRHLAHDVGIEILEGRLLARLALQGRVVEKVEIKPQKVRVHERITPAGEGAFFRAARVSRIRGSAGGLAAVANHAELRNGAMPEVVQIGVGNPRRRIGRAGEIHEELHGPVVVRKLNGDSGWILNS
jgi:hypothetical protein